MADRQPYRMETYSSSPHSLSKLDVSFNARDALFYLVKPQSIEVLDEKGTLQKRNNDTWRFPCRRISQSSIV